MKLTGFVKLPPAACATLSKMTSHARERRNSNEEPTDKEITALEPGDVVVDREDTAPDEAVVIDLPDALADEWNAYDDVTVAEDNPDYAEDAPVVLAVFTEDLLEARPDYDGERIPAAYAEGFKFYSFPAPRLEDVGEFEPPKPELDEDLEPVEERLAESATVEREERTGEVVLVVEKLGEEYVIRGDGSVAGDGAVRDRLEDVVMEVLE